MDGFPNEAKEEWEQRIAEQKDVPVVPDDYFDFHLFTIKNQAETPQVYQIEHGFQVNPVGVTRSSASEVGFILYGVHHTETLFQTRAPFVTELVVIRETVDGEPAYDVGKVIRLLYNSNKTSYEIQLLQRSEKGSYTLTTGKRYRETVERDRIMLVGISLTTKTAKITKHDRRQIEDLLAA